MLDLAPDDLDEPVHVVRNLLRDIREVRQAKARTGVREINEWQLRMDNLGLLEINEIRPFVGTLMDELRHLTSAMQDVAGPEEEEEEKEEGNGDDEGEDDDIDGDVF